MSRMMFRIRRTIKQILTLAALLAFLAPARFNVDIPINVVIGPSSVMGLGFLFWVV